MRRAAQFFHRCFILLLFLHLSSCTADDSSPQALPPCPAIDKLPSPVLPAPRDLFYVKHNVSYMNTATLGPMPRPALKCAVQVWETFETDPVDMYPWGSGMELDEVRGRAAAELGCDLDELVLTPSTTVSLNMVGEGLASTGFFSSGSGAAKRNALTTDQEHGGGLAWLLHWQAAGMVDRVDTVAVPYGRDATSETVLKAFSDALAAAEAGGEFTYDIVFASHILTTTGLQLPLAELAQLAHDHGALFVVDGAQAPGGVHVDLHATGADVYTVSAHKWLLAPTGSGLLYVKNSSAVRDLVRPTYLDGGYSAYTQASGTVPLQSIAGLGYVLDFFAAFGGTAAAEAHNLALRETTYDALVALVDRLLLAGGGGGQPAARTGTGMSSMAAAGKLGSANYTGLEVISPPAASGVASPIVSLNLPPAVISNTDCVSRLLSEFGVVVKLLPDHEGGNPFVENAIRISHHIFNDDRDVEKLLAGLTALLTQG